jgi:hypothetical protein
VVDDELQRVRGFGTIVDDRSTGSGGRTVVDMTDVYKDQLAQARRAVTLKPDASVAIDDHIQADDQPRSVRWGMVTRADVELGGAEAVLRQDGRTLRLRVTQPEGAQLRTFNTADPPRSYDVKNPGTRMVGLVVELDANEAKQLTVELIPGGKE